VVDPSGTAASLAADGARTGYPELVERLRKRRPSSLPLSQASTSSLGFAPSCMTHRDSASRMYSIGRAFAWAPLGIVEALNVVTALPLFGYLLRLTPNR
jgi:hypothetical protein